MTLSSFNLSLLTSCYSPFIQLLIIHLVITGILLFSRLSETLLIESGIYLFFAWMGISFLISFFADDYWYYILNWFLAIIGFFIYWFLAMLFCERYGKPYTGDGGMVMILPIYLFPVVMISSIIIKGLFVIIRNL